MSYRSSKTYGHDVGLSCAFRQWRADHSHCSYIHGYALSVHIEFEADSLDHRNWVVDFGGLKNIKSLLKAKFDHKLVVAHDDPAMSTFLELDNQGLAEVVVMPAVGCEAFAEEVFQLVEAWLHDNTFEEQARVRVHHVTISEHGANSASYYREGAQ